MTLGIGDTLRAARRQQRRSLSDAAAETRVRESYLAALEQEEWSALGGDVYVKGFLRSYAKYLGLDGDPLVEAYRREHERPEEPAPLSPAAQPALPAPRAAPPAQALWIGGVALLLVLFVVIGLLNDGDETQLDGAAGPSPAAGAAPDPTASPEVAAVDPDQEAVRSDEETGEGGAGEPFEALDVEVSLDGGESWMRVTVDGEVAAEGSQSEGETLSFRADELVEMRVGNASAVRLEVNGEDQGSLGDDGDVVEVECEVGATSCEVTPA